MGIKEMLSPKPLPPFIPETEESRRFHLVSDSLKEAGVYGEDNTMETCRILGIKAPCEEEGQKNE